MTITLSVTELSNHLSDYLDRVIDRHEHFIVLRNNQAVAELRPIQPKNRLSDLPALLDSLQHLTPEEAEAFARDMYEVQSNQPPEQLRNPWDS